MLGVEQGDRRENNIYPQFLRKQMFLLLIRSCNEKLKKNRKKMKLLNKFALVAVMLLATLMMVKADLPVHCLYNSTAPGVWEFQLTDQNMSGDDVAAKCDIRAPIQPTRSMKVYLQMPDVAIDEKGNKGFFTLVYDQGFEVVVGGNKYWAFFNYTTAGKGMFFWGIYTNI